VSIASGKDHNIALKSDGTVWTWGLNDQGQLGNGEQNSNINPVPKRVPDLEGIISIAAGYKHSVVLKNNGTAWAWGYNGHGQLGNGSRSNSRVPVKVQGLKDPVVVIPGLLGENGL
jgi:alpha-tubulin suppressor-like RCC1 family protein